MGEPEYEMCHAVSIDGQLTVSRELLGWLKSNSVPPEVQSRLPMFDGLRIVASDLLPFRVEKKTDPATHDNKSTLIASGRCFLSSDS